jgi:hypothetical protein
MLITLKKFIQKQLCFFKEIVTLVIILIVFFSFSLSKMKKIHGIEHVYILSNKRFESVRYNFLSNWASREFDPNYYTFQLQSYKHTLDPRDVSHFGINESRLTKSEVSLIVNYMTIFETILEKYKNFPDKTAFLILESDIIPEDDWKSTLDIQMTKLIQNSENKNMPFHFMHIGNGGNKTFLPTLFKYNLKTEPDIYAIPSSRCAEAIIWTLAGIKEFISTKNYPVNWPLDYYINKICSFPIINLENTNCYWSHPPVFSQGSSSGIYSSTLIPTDSKEIPEKRLKPLPVINILFDNAECLHYKFFIKRLLHYTFGQELDVVSIPVQNCQLQISTKSSCLESPQKSPVRIVICDDIEQIFFSKYSNSIAEIHFPRICCDPTDFFTSIAKLDDNQKSIDITWFEFEANSSIQNLRLKDTELKIQQKHSKYAKYCLVKQYSSDTVIKLLENSCIPIFIDNSDDMLSNYLLKNISLHMNQLTNLTSKKLKEKLDTFYKNFTLKEDFGLQLHEFFDWNHKDSDVPQWMKSFLNYLEKAVSPVLPKPP